MNPFFITGLPRSRTAWLANLFTTDRTLCFHDPTVSVSELIAGGTPFRVGVSDSTLPLRFEAVMERYEKAPWLYVERDPEAAMLSFLGFTKEHVDLDKRLVERFWKDHQRASAELRKRPNVLTVAFDQLSDPETIRRAWHHLIPEVEWNPLRLAQLENMNVQCRLSNRIKELTAWP